MSTSSGDHRRSVSGDDGSKVGQSAAAAAAAEATTTKPSRTQTQGVQLISLGLKSAKIAVMLLAVWLVGYFGFSVTWVLLALICYVIGDEYKKALKSKREYIKQAVQDEQQAILARVDELPSWVYFPDVERAEWLNKMIQQMWPYIGEFVKNLLKTSVEVVVNDNLPAKLKPFRFEKINLGNIPPRLGGVKVYVDKVKRDEILLDIELTYASDADLTVSVRGLNAGVKDILVQGTVRVIMRPLINQIPLVGGLCVFFLNQPKIDFDLTDAANILDMPLLSTSLRTIVSDQIANFLVLPNKLPIPLVKDIDLIELKYPLPAGVLRLTIVEASDLIKADVGILGKGKSDPYCKFYAGGYVHQTAVVKDSINPVWNETFEVIIDFKHGQVVDIDVMDEDPGDDDQLGSSLLEVDQLEVAGGVDAWLQLENVKSGRLHLKALWLHLSKDKDDIYKAKTCRGNDGHLSAALLIVTVDSAKDLMSGKRSVSEPSAYVRLELGNHEVKTRVKQKTTNPRWEECFRFLLVDPELQDLLVEVFNSNKNNKRLGVCKVPLHQLLNANDMTLNQPFALKDADSECSITLRLVLRLLTPDAPAESPDDVGLKKAETSGHPTQPVAATATAEQSSGGGGSSVGKDPGMVPAKTDGRSDSIASSVFDQSETTGLRYRGPTVPDDGRFGRVQVTIRYSTQRSLLVVCVHRCSNLIPCDADNLSDPYVRLVLLPDKSSKKKKVPTATLR